MSNPNINTSMFDDDGLIAYRDSIARQLAELFKYRHDTVQDLGRRGLRLADLNQGSTGALNPSVMGNEQVLAYQDSLDERIHDLSVKLETANNDLSDRWNHRSVA